MSVKIIKSINEWQEIYAANIKDKKSLGFVATMGALHIGHISLIQRSLKENDLTICSIFINPTQFNNPDDLSNYPTTIEGDIKLLESVGCNFLFLPTQEIIYPDGYNYILTEKTLSSRFCGAHRPGHFDGVLTVVLKLLNIIQCDNAYFGEKDWQQYKLIKGMARALFLNCNIIPCTLIREDDGLAFSSRNKNLSPKNREIAPYLYKIISSDTTIESMKKELTALGFAVDYIEEMDNRLLAAASLGKVRLIDNVKKGIKNV
ncbi:MAG: pantoate--beta-alanine ligase [Spirochaetaceae bacterium 4572_7]|nr:MAG: pantoate--beta-alanine ligase [Spirochaetaceae bacterium 4572_7]